MITTRPKGRRQVNADGCERDAVSRKARRILNFRDLTGIKRRMNKRARKEATDDDR